MPSFQVGATVCQPSVGGVTEESPNTYKTSTLVITFDSRSDNPFLVSELSVITLDNLPLEVLKSDLRTVILSSLSFVLFCKSLKATSKLCPASSKWIELAFKCVVLLLTSSITESISNFVPLIAALGLTISFTIISSLIPTLVTPLASHNISPFSFQRVRS